jgi:hypothetical protein
MKLRASAPNDKPVTDDHAGSKTPHILPNSSWSDPRISQLLHTDFEQLINGLIAAGEHSLLTLRATSTRILPTPGDLTLRSPGLRWSSEQATQRRCREVI